MERLTRQKQAVVQALERSGRSLNPAEIWSAARADVPQINLSTVYRHLKSLHDEGQILRVDLPGQIARFESRCQAPHAHGDDHHHHHFHCTDCDRVFPIHACPGPMQELAPPGFVVHAHDLTLHGRCAECRARR